MFRYAEIASQIYLELNILISNTWIFFPQGVNSPKLSREDITKIVKAARFDKVRETKKILIKLI